MSNELITELERSIDRFFKTYSARRVALAALVLGISSIGAAWLVYALTMSVIFSVLAFGLMGLVLVNVAILMVIPPTGQLDKSKQLLLSAVKDRSRIKSIEKHKVVLFDEKDNTHLLKGAELQAWQLIILPSFIKNGVEPQEKGQAKTGRKFTASERRYIEEQKKVMLEREKSMAEEQKRIAEEKARIETEREELKRRDQQLNDAEEIVINRLSEVETVQVELEQMRENLDIKAGTLDGTKHVANDKVLKEREAALKAKETELDTLKKQLLEDQKILQTQKTDLNQLKGELLQRTAPDSEPSSLTDTEEHEHTLEKRLRKLEEETRKLEERSRYVEEVESSLIERLNSLSEREASIEQSEINSGRFSE
jgi:DNA repair exonuclease SbcCD ATPase subunit